MRCRKPQIKDLPEIENILKQWTELSETNKYIERIKNEINGISVFEMQFWVIIDNENIIGIGALAKPLPVSLKFAKTANSYEIKILYIDGQKQRKGAGKKLLIFLEDKAKSMSITELLVRSAMRYKFSAYGFYEKMGYEKTGVIENNSNGIKQPMQVFSKTL